MYQLQEGIVVFYGPEADGTDDEEEREGGQPGTIKNSEATGAHGRPHKSELIALDGNLGWATDTGINSRQTMKLLRCPERR